MRFSTRARYGTKAMVELAMNYGERPMLLRNIARRGGVPGGYLENIMAVLVSAGLVQSMRGRNGGFSLARPPREIRLSQIVSAVEGSLAPAKCIGDMGSCERMSRCVVWGVWDGLQGTVLKYLDEITLSSLAEEQKRLEGAGTPEGGR